MYKLHLKSGTPQISSHMLQGTDKRTDQWYYILDEADVQKTHEMIELWLNPDTTAGELISEDSDG